MEFTDKYDFAEGTQLTWPLKLLFFIGGQIAMATIGGPILAIFHEAGAPFFVLVGLSMMIGSIAMTRTLDNEKLILAAAYPLFLSGDGLFIAGLAAARVIDDAFVFVFISLILLITAWIFCRNHLMRQFFLLAIFILFPLLIVEGHELFQNVCFYYAILLLFIYGLTIVNDVDKYTGKCDEKSLYAQYIPTIRFCAVVVSIGYALFGIDQIAQSIICALYSFVVACIILSQRMKDTQWFFLCAGVIFIGCVASGITPNISLAILGMILTFTVLDYIGVIAFGLFLIYSIGKFYYDLDMTLINKSYLLMGSGVIFLCIFFSIKKLIR